MALPMLMNKDIVFYILLFAFVIIMGIALVLIVFSK